MRVAWLGLVLWGCAATPLPPVARALPEPTIVGESCAVAVGVELEPDRPCVAADLADAVGAACAIGSAVSAGELGAILARLDPGRPLAVTYYSSSGMSETSVSAAELPSAVARVGSLARYLRVADEPAVRVLGCEDGAVYWLVLGDPYRRATLRFERGAAAWHLVSVFAATP